LGVDGHGASGDRRIHLTTALDVAQRDVVQLSRQFG
jgi:hypothetical protein